MPVDAASYSSLPESCSPSCCLGGADVGRFPNQQDQKIGSWLI